MRARRSCSGRARRGGGSRNRGGGELTKPVPAQPLRFGGPAGADDGQPEPSDAALCRRKSNSRSRVCAGTLRGPHPAARGVRPGQSDNGGAASAARRGSQRAGRRQPHSSVLPGERVQSPGRRRRCPRSSAEGRECERQRRRETVHRIAHGCPARQPGDRRGPAGLRSRHRCPGFPWRQSSPAFGQLRPDSGNLAIAGKRSGCAFNGEQGPDPVASGADQRDEAAPAVSQRQFECKQQIVKPVCERLAWTSGQG